MKAISKFDPIRNRELSFPAIKISNDEVYGAVSIKGNSSKNTRGMSVKGIALTTKYGVP